jgi:hypothetical protein
MEDFDTFIVGLAAWVLSSYPPVTEQKGGHTKESYTRT